MPGLEGIIWYVLFFALYALIWYPFYKTFEKKTIADEEAAKDAEAAGEMAV